MWLPCSPGYSSGVAGSLAGGSFISKVLLANADALCAAVSPLMQEEIDMSVPEPFGDLVFVSARKS